MKASARILLPIATLVLCILFGSEGAAFPSPHSSSGDFPFRNTSLSWDERVDDLVGRLTLQEVAEQMTSGGANLNGPAPAIERLGIGKYQWGTECLAGDIGAGTATSYPISIGLAAAFDRSLLEQVARATAVEVRAKHNDYIRDGNYDFHTGLSCWSPVINLAIHPLWGRNQETYGECPVLSGELAVAFVRGLQNVTDMHDASQRFLLTNAGCKHLGVYNGPENIPSLRYSFNAQVSESDLRQSFLPAFQRCVEAGATSVMCSYTAMNGVPCCANRYLLTDILRGDFNFTGYVVSDQGALEFIVLFHRYTDSLTVAAADAANAGVSLEDADWHIDNVFTHLVKAVEKGLVTEDVLRAHAKALFYTRMRLGEFDPPPTNPYSDLNVRDNVLTKEHIALSRRAVQKSMVLLKNVAPPESSVPLLPLNGSLLSAGVESIRIYIIGPFASNTKHYYGDYSATYNRSDSVSIEQGIRNWAAVERLGTQIDIHVHDVCLFGPRCYVLDEIALREDLKKQSLSSSDLVIVAVGTGTEVEAEAKDRKSMALPGEQPKLIPLMAELAPSTPRLVVQFSGAPITLDEVEGSSPSSPSSVIRANSKRSDGPNSQVYDAVHGILQAWFPAQETGNGLADIMFGIVSPSARLPTSWPSHSNSLPPMTSYNVSESPTYRYNVNNIPIRYPFGYGLSYTTFALSGLSVDPSPKLHLPLPSTTRVSFSVKNTGPYESDIVLTAFGVWNRSELAPEFDAVPVNSLLEFTCIEGISPGQVKTVTLELESQKIFSIFSSAADAFKVPLGPWTLSVYVGSDASLESGPVSNTLEFAFSLD